jgi:hypothetical protein
MIIGKNEFLEYMTWDNTPWKCKVVADGGVQIPATFQHVGSNTHNENYILYFSDVLQKWKAEIYWERGPVAMVPYFRHTSEGGEQHEGNVIRFIDWTGVKWEAYLGENNFWMAYIVA